MKNTNNFTINNIQIRIYNPILNQERNGYYEI